MRRNWRPLTVRGRRGGPGAWAWSPSTPCGWPGRATAAVARPRGRSGSRSSCSNLFQGGDEEAGPADTLRVVTLVDRGVREARALDGRARSTGGAVPDSRRRSTSSWGSWIGRTPCSRAALAPCGGRSTRRRPATWRRHSWRWAGCARSRRTTRRGRAAHPGRTGHGAPRPCRWTSRGGAGDFGAGAGAGQPRRLRAGHPHPGEAVRLQSAGRPRPRRDRSASITELANYPLLRRALRHLGFPEPAGPRRWTRVLYGARHPHIGDDLINLGAIQFEWGHYPEAERYVPRRRWRSSRLGMARTIPRRPPASRCSPGLSSRGAPRRGSGTAPPRARHSGAGLRPGAPARRLHAQRARDRVAQQEGRLDEAEADFRRMADIYRAVYHEKH